MGRIVTITSGKGGVGKSTTTANLATGLAMMGREVVAIDFDIGLRNLDMLLGLENRIVYDVVDLMEGRCNLSQAIIKDKRTKGLHFLPASQTKDKSVLEKGKVEQLLNSLREKFDYILIDSPAGIESGFEHAIYLADTALIVTTPDVSSVRDADRVIGIIDAKSKKAQQGEEVEKFVIINRIKPELVQRGEMLSVEDILQILALPLIGLLPEDEEIIRATNLGEPVILNPKSRVGAGFKNIARRLLGEEVPFTEIEERKGFFERLKRLFK
ncbi:MAG: septum site-determining protein MinD [Campylobacterales bacterium]